jgi:vacuolar-type H+-ATPase subunit E/Vma4
MARKGDDPMAKDGNGRINNTQRRILANLAVEVLNGKVQQARDESGNLVAEIRAKVKEELGVIAMDIEIETMQKQIEALLKRYPDPWLTGKDAGG